MVRRHGLRAPPSRSAGRIGAARPGSREARQPSTCSRPPIRGSRSTRRSRADREITFPKVDTQIAGGAGPDIIQMGGNIGDYVKKGVLLPLDKYAGTVLNTSRDRSERDRIRDHRRPPVRRFHRRHHARPGLQQVPAQRVGAPLPKVSMTYDEFRAYLRDPEGEASRGRVSDAGHRRHVFQLHSLRLLDADTTARRSTTRSTNTTAVKAADAQKYLELFRDYRNNGLIPPADIAAGYAETNADTSAIIAGKVAIGYIYGRTSCAATRPPRRTSSASSSSRAPRPPRRCGRHRASSTP